MRENVCITTGGMAWEPAIAERASKL